MRFTTIHDPQRGLVRLLSAPRDLPSSAPWKHPPLDRDGAAHGYRELFAEYEEELEDVLNLAEEWWEDGIQRCLQEGQDREAVIESAYARAFAGPAALPEMVWVVRKFWLRCVALNREMPEDQRVPPEVFLLHWLDDGQHIAHVQVLTGMPYWPIGLDEHGNWV